MRRSGPNPAVFVKVEKGKTYLWCQCRLSATQPFCDGSHKNTVLKPIPFTAEKDGEAMLCGCRKSSEKPFCDGTHNL